MKPTFVCLTALLLLFAIGCGNETKTAEEISDSLQDKGTTELLEEAAEDEYEPPADGRLTDAQVEMYLKVRERERDIAKVARQEAAAHSKKAEDKSLGGLMAGFKSIGSLADFATADIRAAKELGYNTAEYQWVKGKVLEVSTADMGQKLNQAGMVMADAAYTQLKQSYDSATDEASKQQLKQMLDEYEKQRNEMAAEKEEEDPSITYNRQLLSKYEGTLNALVTELAKWEENEGDAAKGVEEWEKNLDEAIDKAKQEQSQ